MKEENTQITNIKKEGGNTLPDSMGGRRRRRGRGGRRKKKKKRKRKSQAEKPILPHD